MNPIRHTNDTMVWLNKLNAFQSVDDIRHSLTARDPAFDTGRLKQLAVVGAAGEGHRLVDLCGKLGIKVIAVCDDTPSKQGVQVGSVKVQSMEALTGLDRETPVIIASHRVLRAAERLSTMGFRHVAPFA